MRKDAFAFLSLADKNQLSQELTQCHVQRQAGQVKVADVLHANEEWKLIPKTTESSSSATNLQELFIPTHIV